MKIIRAKFQSKEEQRKFFLDVKKATKMGSRKLSRLLDLKSRGGLESYTACRTSPELSIVKKLEELSGLKANYEIIHNNKNVMVKRKIVTMPYEEAENILRKRFGDMHYSEILKFIEQDENLDDIANKLRSYGYRFDNHIIVRALGSLKLSRRFGLLEKFDEMRCAVLDGYVQNSRGSFLVRFSLGFLRQKLSAKNCKIGFIINDDYSKVKIFPLKGGKKLSASDNRLLRFHIPTRFPLKHNSRVKVLLNPKDFGYSLTDFVQDEDARKLAHKALERGFVIHPVRSTTNNAMGDIVLEYKDRKILIEITRFEKQQAANWKLGQVLLQRINYPSFTNFLILNKGVLSKSHLRAFDRIVVTPITVDFGGDWENRALDFIEKSIQT